MSKCERTIIVYLIGRPGTGKYTISQELAKSGYVICDNQLVNNVIFTLLEYDGFSEIPIPSFAWDAIAKIRNNVFDFLTIEKNKNYVLTNVLYEEEGDRKLYDQVKQVALKRGSLFVPVKLLITEEENLKRIIEPSRRKRWKSIDPKDVYSQIPLINISHPNLLEIDVTKISAKKVAEKITKRIATIS